MKYDVALVIILSWNALIEADILSLLSIYIYWWYFIMFKETNLKREQIERI